MYDFENKILSMTDEELEKVADKYSLIQEEIDKQREKEDYEFRKECSRLYDEEHKIDYDYELEQKENDIKYI